MTFNEAYKKLGLLGTEQNRKVYAKNGAPEPLFGVSFANLKSLKKEIISEDGKKGVNQNNAIKLWETDNSDCRTFALMIAEPLKITFETIEKWTKETNYHILADMLGEIITKSKFKNDFTEQFTRCQQEYKIRIGFSIVSYNALNTENLDDEYFIPYVEQITEEIHTAPNRAKEGMNNCIIAIGGRNKKLKELVLEKAKLIGTVEIDHGETSCKTFEIEPYINKIWERKLKKLTKK